MVRDERRTEKVGDDAVTHDHGVGEHGRAKIVLDLCSNNACHQKPWPQSVGSSRNLLVHFVPSSRP
jgi:hypothetical protein